jgi:hypothetical protein
VAKTMLKSFRHYSFFKLPMLAIFSVLLVACVGGDDGGAVSTTSAGSVAADDVNLVGSVGDGPVTGASVEIWSAQGRLIKTIVSDNTASFKSRIRINRSYYPLLLKVQGGVDLVTGAEPDFQMLSVMLDRDTSRVNINPFSTLIVRIAQSMSGGINATTINLARDIVTKQLGFGLDPTLIADPISTTLTDSNIANLVKSSEAMGEMIRRTRDLLKASGKSVSGDTVMIALAADIKDGKLDGLGANGVDPRITAVVKVTSGQVLVEALANALKVHGVIATVVIDQAIVTTRPGISNNALTQYVRITDGMIQQTLAALASARVLDTSYEIDSLQSIVSGISAGALPGDVESVLPADASRSLDNAMLLAVTATDVQLTTVNTALTTAPTVSPVTTDPVTTDPVTTDPVTTDPVTTDPVTTDPVTTDPVTTDPVTETPVNHAPVISGTPTSSVMATTSYSFQPVASDVDGNALTFSISGKPAWATFSMTSGSLGGVPGSGDVGSYSNIVIQVNDGTDTASLAAFSINVTALPPPPLPANTAPQISGKPAGSVAAGSNYLFQPSASDADGNVLTFSISGKPAWASFDTATGALSGTPFNADAGSYPNIVISVSDGVAVASLPAFSIQVTATTGSFILQWTAPSSRADGSPLSLADIGGYRIYYGTSAGNLSQMIDVTDGSETSTTVSNLSTGTWYVAMTTYDVSGLESSSSGAINKTAQ